MLTKKAIEMFGLKWMFLAAVLATSLQAQVEPDRSGVGQAEFLAARNKQSVQAHGLAPGCNANGNQGTSEVNGEAGWPVLVKQE